MFLIFNSVLVRAQTDTMNFHLKDGNIVFENIYEFPNYSKDSLKNNLAKFLQFTSSIGDLKEISDGFTGTIKGLKINYKKYGGKYMSTWIILNHSMFGNFIIEIKEGKYRLIIKDIYFIDDVSLAALDTKNPDFNKTNFSEIATRKNRTRFGIDRIVIKGLEYMKKDLTEKFKLVIDKDNW